jgi:hypothetical protein
MALWFQPRSAPFWAKLGQKNHPVHPKKIPKKTYGIRLKTRVVHPMVTTQFDHLTAPTREDLLHNKHHLEPSTRIQFALGILMGAVEIQSGNMLRGWAVKHIRQERCRGLVTL